MRRGRLLVALLVLMCLPLLIAATWAPWASERTIQDNGIFISSDRWRHPEVDGDWALYSRYYASSSKLNLFAQYLPTGGPLEACTTTDAISAQEGRISGDWVVYMGNDGDWGVWSYNLKTNVATKLTGAGDQTYPDVSGSNAIYNDNGTLRIQDLTGAPDSALIIDTGLPDFTNRVAAISGNRIAYVKSNSIWLKDLVTGTITEIDGTADNCSAPDIDGDIVVWQQMVGGTGPDIRGYDVATGTTFDVSGAVSGTQEAPRVSGTRVVWHDYRAGADDADIYAWDAIKRKSVVVSGTSSGQPNQLWPSISGNKIVWLEVESGDYWEGPAVRMGVLNAPVLTLSAPSVVGYGGAVKVSGTLKENGIALGGRAVRIFKSTDQGHTWTETTSTPTSSGGSFSVNAGAATKRTLYKAQYDGETNFLSGSLSRFSAVSSAAVVLPKVALGTPSSVSTVRRNAGFVVSGTLKPRHTAGTKPVRVLAYQRVNGVWKLRKTFYASASDYSSYSKYRVSAKLPYAGYWRLRAYYPTSFTNSATYSSYKYVRAY